MGRLNVSGGTCHAGLPAAGPGPLHPAMGGCSHLQAATAAPVLRGMPGAWLNPEVCHLGCGSPLWSWQAHCMQLRSLHLVSLLSQLTKTTTYLRALQTHLPEGFENALLHLAAGSLLVIGLLESGLSCVSKSILQEPSPKHSVCCYFLPFSFIRALCLPAPQHG